MHGTINVKFESASDVYNNELQTFQRIQINIILIVIKNQKFVKYLIIINVVPP
jgi:hypothetical protein